MRFILPAILNFFLIIGISAQSLEIDSLRKELSLTKDISKQLDIQIVLAHHMSMIDMDSVKHYAGNVVRISKAQNDNENLCHGYLKYALGYFILKTIPQSSDLFWAYMDSAYNVATKHDYYHGITAYYQLKAVYYMETSDYEKSIDNMLLVTQRCKIEKDSISFAYSIYNLADMYRLSGQYEKALNIILDDMDIIDKLKYDNIYFYIQTIMGKLYGELKMYNKSFTCYKIVYDNQLMKASRPYKLEIIQSLAYGYYKLGMKDSADYFFQEVIKLSKTDDRKSIRDDNYFSLSKYLLEEKDYNKAEKYMLVTLKYSKENAASASELIILTDLAKLYEAKRDFGKALNFINRYVQLKDSIKIEGLDYLLDKALSDMQLKDKIVELNMMKSQMIKRIYIIISYSVLAVLLFFIIWYTLATILFNFYKTHVNKDLISTGTSLWKYIPPLIIPTTLTTFISSLLFILVTFFTYKFLFQDHSSGTNTIIWLFISGILFFVTEKIYFQFLREKKNLTFVQELGALLCGLPIFVFLLTGIAFLMGIIELISIQTIYLALLLVGNILITLSINSLVQYRMRFELLNESMLQEFNRKIALRNKKIETKLENNEKPHDIISVDNAGKNVDIDLSTVIYIVSENVYQEFICMSEDKISKILVRNTLSTIENQLKTYPDFLRCHRSYIVNTCKIKALEGNSRQKYFLLDMINEKIPISRSLAFEILNQFEPPVYSVGVS